MTETEISFVKKVKIKQNRKDTNVQRVYKYQGDFKNCHFNSAAILLPLVHSELTKACQTIPQWQIFVFLSSHDQGSEPLRSSPRCPLENEDGCFNRFKQFDLQVLLPPCLITLPASEIIDTLSTPGRRRQLQMVSANFFPPPTFFFICLPLVK